MRSAPDQVTVQRLIPAPAEAIFDLLADPARHHEIDGSGTVVAPTSSRGARRLGLGDSFGMSMKWGVPYSTRNVVTEFEENRRIAWRTLAPAPLDKLFTGRTWRYELEPRDGATLVKETWDISTEAWLGRPAVRRLADLTRRNMSATLERIEAVVTAA
ncbi:MAG TPA: dimethyladenosine transferase [Intrasporangiaceae bacterium]|nr:dimethyladenosine transferase [Intrasporangiaceae bacterium]